MGTLYLPVVAVCAMPASHPNAIKAIMANLKINVLFIYIQVSIKVYVNQGFSQR